MIPALALIVVSALLQVQFTVNASNSCPWTCVNSSTCKLSNDGSWYCDCLHDDDSGYQGVHCQTPYQNCHDGDKRNWRCYNEASCGSDGNTCTCGDSFSGQFCQDFEGDCSSGTSGPHCENYNKINGITKQATGSSSDSLDSGLIAGLVVFGFIILALSATVTIICAGKKSMQKRSSASQDNDIEFAPKEIQSRPIDDAVTEGKAEII